MSELDPKDVLADLFGEELPLDDPERVAEMVIERLRDASSVIKPADEPGELGRLKDAKRRALHIADERAREAVELRLENERLEAQLAECAAPKTA